MNSEESEPFFVNKMGNAIKGSKQNVKKMFPFVKMVGEHGGVSIYLDLIWLHSDNLCKGKVETLICPRNLRIKLVLDIFLLDPSHH